MEFDVGDAALTEGGPPDVAEVFPDTGAGEESETVAGAHAAMSDRGLHLATKWKGENLMYAYCM